MDGERGGRNSMNLLEKISSRVREREWRRAPKRVRVLARQLSRRFAAWLPSKWRLQRDMQYEESRRQHRGPQNHERLRELRRDLRRERRKSKRLRGRIRDLTLEIQALDRQLEYGDGSVALTQRTRFFVVGEMKSGTSWLMWMLNSHPEIFCSGEGNFFGRNQRNQETDEIPILNHPTPSLRNALLDSEGLRTWHSWMWWNYWGQQGGDADEDLRNLTRLAVDYYMMQGSAVSGKPIVGDKSPPHADYVDEIFELCPEAKVVHIVRDGRDSAVSLMNHYWALATDRNKKNGIYDLKPEERAKRDAYWEDPEGFLASGDSIFVGERLRQIAARWSRRVDKAARDGKELLGDNFLQLHYEDLLAKPEEHMKTIFELLGARADEEVVRHCVEENAFEKLAKRPKGQEKSGAFFRKGIAGDWRRVFTDHDRRIYEEVAGETLRAMGYQLD